MPSYVIVGASRGLGYEWLRQLSNEPANEVFGVVRTPGLVAERLVADNIQNVHLVEGDMADNKSLVAAATAVKKLSSGAVDYLIVNGAYASLEETWVYPTEFSDKEDLLTLTMVESLKVNVIGVVFSINAFLPLVRKSRIKKVTVISTGLADRELAEYSTNPFLMTYSAMKAALNIVVAKFAVELRNEGIIMLALSPGVVDTSADKSGETVMTETQEQRMGIMMKDFSVWCPAWQGPLQPAESVQMQRKVINEIGIEQSGAFLSHHGDKNWL